MNSKVKNTNSELISKRWAKALMELVLENDAIPKEDILRDLENIAETINSSEELSLAINNPSITTEEKQIILCKLFQNNTIPIVYNFIFALNLRKRVNLIDEIIVEFKKELDEINNRTHIGVTSAIELSETKKEEIKSRIKAKLNKEVVIDWNIDESIIAGLIFNINETIVDGSIRHKLEDIGKSIIH